MDLTQFKKLTDGLAGWEMQRQSERRANKSFQRILRQTTPCDGASVAAVRAWIKDVELASNELGTNEVINVAAGTAAGPLRWELERYPKSHTSRSVARSAIPWNDVKEHLRKSFLPVDEQSALREEVEQTKQSAYELEAEYSRRFRELADAAYPSDTRNEDKQRLLIKAFARGFKSDSLARKLVETGNPSTIDDAIDKVSGYSARKDAYSRLNRQEEPMDVSQVNSTRPPPETNLPTLHEQLERIQTRLAKLETTKTPKVGWVSRDAGSRRQGQESAVYCVVQFKPHAVGRI